MSSRPLLRLFKFAPLAQNGPTIGVARFWIDNGRESKKIYSTLKPQQWHHGVGGLLKAISTLVGNRMIMGLQNGFQYDLQSGESASWCSCVCIFNELFQDSLALYI